MFITRFAAADVILCFTSFDLFVCGCSRAKQLTMRRGLLLLFSFRSEQAAAGLQETNWESRGEKFAEVMEGNERFLVETSHLETRAVIRREVRALLLMSF